MKEIPLKGGSSSSPVKAGATVRRPRGYWSEAVQSLLGHLEQRGIDFVPRPLGFDEKNREVISFLPGEAAFRPWPQIVRSDDGLHQLGAMLRRYHDAVRDFVPPEDATWRIKEESWRPGMIIRHGDLGPWNTLWQQEQLTGLIDFEFAGPGAAITDVAQAVWYFAPLRGESGWEEAGFAQRPDFQHRIDVIVAAYGDFDSEAVLDELDRLQTADMAVTKRYGEAGIHPWAGFWARGGYDIIAREQSWLREQRARGFQAVISKKSED